MLGGVKEANCFIAFEITLMQRAIMIHDSYLYHAMVMISLLFTSPWLAPQTCVIIKMIIPHS